MIGQKQSKRPNSSNIDASENPILNVKRARPTSNFFAELADEVQTKNEIQQPYMHHYNLLLITVFIEEFPCLVHKLFVILIALDYKPQ